MSMGAAQCCDAPSEAAAHGMSSMVSLIHSVQGSRQVHPAGHQGSSGDIEEHLDPAVVPWNSWTGSWSSRMEMLYPGIPGTCRIRLIWNTVSSWDALIQQKSAPAERGVPP